MSPPRNNHSEAVPSTNHHIAATATPQAATTASPRRVDIMRAHSRDAVGIAASAPHRIDAARVSVPMYTRVAPLVVASTIAAVVEATMATVVVACAARSGFRARRQSAAMTRGHTT